MFVRVCVRVSVITDPGPVDNALYQEHNRVASFTNGVYSLLMTGVSQIYTIHLKPTQKYKYKYVEHVTIVYFFENIVKFDQHFCIPVS